MNVQYKNILYKILKYTKNMKKQYIFLLMILSILYILYLIVSKTYYEYKINSHIEYITYLNNDIKNKIKDAEGIIKYKSSLAYKNKILKEQQSYKNKWEEVIYLTTQSIYNTFITNKIEKKDIIEDIKIKDSKIDNMNIKQKWLYLIFKKDTY